MGLGKRIRHFREKAGLKLPQMAELSGVDTGTISALEIRDSARSQYFGVLAKAFGMTMEQLADENYDPELVVVMGSPVGYEGTGLQQIKAVYPKTGDGYDMPAFSRRAEEPVAAYGMEPILAWDHPEDLPDGEFVFVPRLDVHLSGGAGREQVEIDLVKDNPQAFRTEWIRLMHLKPNKLAAMRATGDSMEPTIHAGDSLLVDTSQTDVVDGKVYALWYEGGERVKRLFRLPGGGLRIKSDNTAFDPIELPAEYAGHVRVIGRVVHRSGVGGL